MLQDWCGHCFARDRFLFECIEEEAWLICGHCSTAVSGGQKKVEGTATVDFLLMLTAAIDGAIEGREGGGALDEIKAAIETLWSPSQANGKPSIAWLDVKLPFGRLPAFTARGNPLVCLSLPWRSCLIWRRQGDGSDRRRLTSSESWPIVNAIHCRRPPKRPIRLELWKPFRSSGSDPISSIINWLNRSWPAGIGKRFRR
jgi:hypothetical protein